MTRHSAAPARSRLRGALVTTGAVLAVLAGSWAATTASAGPAAVLAQAPPDLDCSEFDAHADAQAAFLASGGMATTPFGVDPMELDPDADGVACEELLPAVDPSDDPVDTTPGEFDPDAPAK